MKFRMADGTDIELNVMRFSEYPRGEDGLCVLCKGDPCNEDPPVEGEPETLIAMYYRIGKENGYTWETCPVCDGRPS